MDGKVLKTQSQDGGIFYILFTALLLLFSHSVVSDSLQAHGLYPTRLLCPWDFPGKNIGGCCHFLLQGIFLTQGSNPCLLHWQADSLPLSHQGSPYLLLPYGKPIWTTTTNPHVKLHKEFPLMTTSGPILVSLSCLVFAFRLSRVEITFEFWALGCNFCFSFTLVKSTV